MKNNIEPSTVRPEGLEGSFIPPAQLWLGTHDTLIAEAQRYLQTFFCTQNGCGTCASCMQIRQQQHHGAIWIAPEKQYTLESLTVIFDTLSFALDADQHIFFILQKTDFLTTACANSLLKSLEEPPHGYHFILLAQNLDMLLPTIKSRCIVKTFVSQSINHAYAQLYSFFTTDALYDPNQFLKAVDASKISERESKELLDTLLIFWINSYAQAARKNNTQTMQTALKNVDIMKAALHKLPMPGSSKLFWKNLFLQMIG